jgi:hypothetical protein
MIHGFNKLRIPDEKGTNPLIVEVNWDEKDDKTNECKMLRFTYPDGTQAYVKKEYFMSFLFAIGKPGKEQMDMIPQTITKVRKYTTMLGIEAKQDIKKGQKINVRVEIPLPAIVDEIVGEVENKHKSGLIIPK